MISPALKTFLEQRLSVHFTRFRPVTGGSISHTIQMSTAEGNSFFLKMNKREQYPGLFNKERLGLQLLQQHIRTPAVVLEEQFEEKQLLVLEWIPAGAKTSKFWTSFGVNLAKLHQQTSAAFGLNYDNYMGALPQANGWRNTWVDLFREHRLEAQAKLAARNGLLPSQWMQKLDNLYQKLPEIFAEEKPALLHGDLWSGNFMCSGNQEPVLVDPAVYYGHRSMDLAMTTLFGKCDQAFYDAYHYHFPLPANYEEQWEIANLYPLLIHLNLFGSSYLGAVTDTLSRF